MPIHMVELTIIEFDKLNRWYDLDSCYFLTRRKPKGKTNPIGVKPNCSDTKSITAIKFVNTVYSMMPGQSYLSERNEFGAWYPRILSRSTYRDLSLILQIALGFDRRSHRLCFPAACKY